MSGPGTPYNGTVRIFQLMTLKVVSGQLMLNCYPSYTNDSSVVASVPVPSGCSKVGCAFKCTGEARASSFSRSSNTAKPVNKVRKRDTNIEIPQEDDMLLAMLAAQPTQSAYTGYYEGVMQKLTITHIGGRDSDDQALDEEDDGIKVLAVSFRSGGDTNEVESDAGF